MSNEILVKLRLKNIQDQISFSEVSKRPFKKGSSDACIRRDEETVMMVWEFTVNFWGAGDT